MAPIATLTVRLGAQIAEFQKSFADTSSTLKKFTHEFEGVATKASAVGSFFGTIAADMARSLAAGFGRAVSDAVRLSSEFSNALIGLGSVSRAFGVDTDAAKDAARALSADGLMPLKDSATGLKNLLATGFNLEQSVKLMNAFKDSAAFGRQSALSFGDAVRSATEGVKNGNSILVDNSGVTKNLSQILKEAGFSAQDLSRASSDAAVRMALFNGILKETRAQTGDAAKLTMTYTGQVSRLGAAYDQTLATIGAAVTQNETVAMAIRAVGDAFFSLNSQLVQNRNAFNLVSDAVIFVAKAFSALIHVADLAQTTLSALQQLFNTNVAAMLNVGVVFLELTQKVANLQKVLDPTQYFRHAAAAKEAGEGAAHLRAMIEGLTAASRESQERSNHWGNTLQGARAKLDALALALEASRGKTVELGNAVTTHTSATNANTAAGEANKRLTSEQAQIKDLQAKANAHAAAALEFETASWKRWEQAVSQALANVSVQLKSRDLSGLVPQINAGGAGNLAGVNTSGPAPSFWKGIFGSSEQFGQQMAGTILGAIQGGGNPVSAAAGMVGSKIGSSIAGSLTKEGGKLFGTALGGALSSALPVVGSLIGPLVGALWGKFFGTAGRDAIKDFAQRLTGSSDLNAMNTFFQQNLPAAEADRFWKLLTQGTGRNNPQQAAANIALVTEALERHKQKQEEVATAAQASADAQQEALDAIGAKYKAEIDKLENEWKSLSDSVAKEAQEEHMGITEALERERMKQIEAEIAAQKAMRDAEIDAKRETFSETLAAGQELYRDLGELFERGYKIPIKFDFPDGIPGAISPSALSSSYTAGMTSGWESRVPAAAMARAGGGTAQFLADGRLLAEIIVPHIPGEVKRLGLNR